MLTGSSAAIVELRDRLRLLSSHPDMPVLVTGPTGVGKEVVTQALHELTAPYARLEPFLCGGQPTTLFESHLFGHEQGSFTGATTRQPGACELAGRGTLMLDEIGDTPLELQAKLLRVVDTRQYRPVGCATDRALHARIVAATNIDLVRAIGDGRFRADLYHRLSAVTLRVPALDERASDIPELVQTFSAEHGEPGAFSSEALEVLRARSYPGNVRQLRGTVRATLALTKDRPIRSSHLQCNEGHATHDDARSRIVAEMVIGMGPPFDERLKQVHDAVLMRVLSNNSKRATARMFNVDASTMRARIKKLKTPQ